MNDHELIQKILAGDHHAVQLLHERYVDSIFHYIYIQTRSYHDAEELIQDVFYKAAKQLHTFEGRSSFKTWIFKIARNAVYDYYRSQNKHKKSFAMDQALLEDMAGEAEAAEDTVLRNFHMDELLLAIEKLPENYQTVLHLRFFEDFSIKETAEIMGKSVLSVKSMQRRARLLLAEQIKSGGENS